MPAKARPSGMEVPGRPGRRPGPPWRPAEPRTGRGTPHPTPTRPGRRGRAGPPTLGTPLRLLSGPNPARWIHRQPAHQRLTRPAGTMATWPKSTPSWTLRRPGPAAGLLRGGPDRLRTSPAAARPGGRLPGDRTLTHPASGWRQVTGPRLVVQIKTDRRDCRRLANCTPPANWSPSASPPRARRRSGPVPHPRRPSLSCPRSVRDWGETRDSNRTPAR
jgi:hypothetical protein